MPKTSWSTGLARLAAHSGGASPDDMRHALEQLWSITRIQRVGRLLP
ncbi:MAG: hypothetical protein QM527_12785 [Alphaproteobacteria bacterium]|nr:hypothetical protein [Alphaproteobacteria bacterium]